MRLTVIGCSGSYPGPDSPASCYLVEEEWEGRTWRILLDLGNGALGELHNHVDPLTIDGVLLSHLHADHFMDLCGYYVLRKYHPLGAQPQIPVWGPPGTGDRLAVSYDLPLAPGMHEEFDFREYPTTSFDFGPFTVEAVEVVHPVPAYSLRVSSNDRLLVYTGDCGPCDGLDARPLVPTCCWPRPRSATATRTPKTCTSPVSRSPSWPRVPAPVISC